jgi:alkylhydroperoxidase family enzyme
MTEIHASFTDPELVELTFLVDYINLLNLFNNSLEVRYRGDYRALLDPVAGA